MRRTLGFSTCMAVALLVSAAVAGSASASLLGSTGCAATQSLVCSPTVGGSAGVLNAGDWNGLKPSYHCNNLLYVGPPSGVGTYPGTAYYTVGHPYITRNLSTTQTPADAAADTDCNGPTSGPMSTWVSSNLATLNGGTDPNQSATVTGSSIVVLQGVGWLNILNNRVSPSPGSAAGRYDNNTSAGYVAVGGPPGTVLTTTPVVDGGLRGTGPAGVLTCPTDPACLVP